MPEPRKKPTLRLNVRWFIYKWVDRLANWTEHKRQTMADRLLNDSREYWWGEPDE